MVLSPIITPKAGLRQSNLVSDNSYLCILRRLMFPQAYKINICSVQDLVSPVNVLRYVRY